LRTTPLLGDVKNKIMISATLAAFFCGCGSQTGEDLEQRDGLLFSLTQDDVQEIHERYVSDEDIDLTTARLSAPFDCALYDGLCDAIGEEAAVDLTRMQVSMALEHESIEEIESFTASYVEGLEPVESPEDEFVLRSSTGWYAHRIGNIRLKTRNGITTYVVGERHVWTEARTEARSGSRWSKIPVQEICVDSGSNTLERRYTDPSGVTDTRVLGSTDPDEVCYANNDYVKVVTTLPRLSGNAWTTYRMNARGAASARFVGLSFSASAPAHLRVY
jgi:hypothetical protein